MMFYNYNTTYNTWYNSYAKYTGSGYKAGSGDWQYKTTTSPLKSIGTTDGRTKYEGYWYNQKKEAVNTSTTVTMYRYRTRTKQNVTTWGGYTAWQDERVSSSSTCEVQTRTVYRYRTLK